MVITENIDFSRSVMAVRPIMFQISRNNRRVCRQQFMNFSLNCVCSVREKWSIKKDLSKVFNFFCMRLIHHSGAVTLSACRSLVYWFEFEGITTQNSCFFRYGNDDYCFSDIFDFPFEIND